MTDRELLAQCYDQLRIMFNPDVPLMQKLTARLAQPEPEPVAWRFYDGNIWCYVDHLTDLPQDKFEPLYTAPPQREWQGLTMEEMQEAMKYWSDPCRSAYGGANSANCEYVDVVDTWRYIEAKLRERNT